MSRKLFKSRKPGVQVEEDEEADQPLKPSPDADTHILFVRPTSTGTVTVVTHVTVQCVHSSKHLVSHCLTSAKLSPKLTSYYLTN